MHDLLEKLIPRSSDGYLKKEARKLGIPFEALKHLYQLDPKRAPEQVKILLEEQDKQNFQVAKKAFISPKDSKAAAGVYYWMLYNNLSRTDRHHGNTKKTSPEKYHKFRRFMQALKKRCDHNIQYRPDTKNGRAAQTLSLRMLIPLMNNISSQTTRYKAARTTKYGAQSLTAWLKTEQQETASGPIHVNAGATISAQVGQGSIGRMTAFLSTYEGAPQDALNAFMTYGEGLTLKDSGPAAEKLDPRPNAVLIGYQVLEANPSLRSELAALATDIACQSQLQRKHLKIQATINAYQYHSAKDAIKDIVGAMKATLERHALRPDKDFINANIVPAPKPEPKLPDPLRNLYDLKLNPPDAGH